MTPTPEASAAARALRAIQSEKRSAASRKNGRKGGRKPKETMTMKRIEVTMTAERLQAMLDNGMSLYFTPGAQTPYWASQPSWANDKCIATPHDFIEAAGYDDLEGVEDDEEFYKAFAI